MFEGAKAGAWDIGFVAIEPVRAAEIEFTAPYVIIDGTYMVRKDSPLKEVDDVDKPGIKIAVGLGSAYDLYLTRTIKNATLVRAKVGGGRAMIEMFVDDKLEAAAGVRQPLEAYAKDHPEMRVMSGAFQQIQQAMGTPKRPRQGRRGISGEIRRGDEGVGLRRRCAEAQRPGRAGRAAGEVKPTEVRAPMQPNARRRVVSREG